MVQCGKVASFPTTLAVAGLWLAGTQGSTMQPLPCFALGQDDGGVDVHCLSRETAGAGGSSTREQQQDEELRALNNILGVRQAAPQVGSALQTPPPQQEPAVEAVEQ